MRMALPVYGHRRFSPSLSKEPSLTGFDPLKNLQRSNFGMERLSWGWRGVSLNLKEEFPRGPDHIWLLAERILPKDPLGFDIGITKSPRVFG